MTDRAAGDETLWDIQADLHFLLEDSQDAIEDLDVAWDVVTTTEDESPEEAKEMPSSSPRNKRKSHEARLRDTKAAQDVAAPQHDAMGKTTSSATKSAAEGIKRPTKPPSAIHANKVFISKMTTLVRKKPKVHPALSLHTSGSVLPAEPTLRRAAIHAIGDNLFRLKDMTFVVAGVLDQMDNSIRVRHVVDLSQRTLTHEITSNMTLPAPSHVVGKAMWQVYNGEQKSSVPATAQVVHERLDDDTVYERFKDKRDGAVCHANRRDAHDNNPMEDHKCWITVEPMDKVSCRLTFVMQILFRANTTPSGRSLLEEMAKSARNLTMESKLPDGGIFSVPMHLPQCVRVLPLYDTLVE
ncbi:hypothetical protein Ae201684_007639 [Aphanomyces euteiches]|uniref:Uncharacterized protein n=1 Tax=Aphanomyces euteiches TaxID=100861 RepID=A0A6G0X869_9STRA|nr:hypothetical protein Ae201684_007639 [Aphanomyces euteiches]